MRNRDRSLTEAERSSEVVTGEALPRIHTRERMSSFYRFAGTVAIRCCCRRPNLSFFLELFFFARSEPRRRTQRLAVVEDRQIAHVQGKSTRRRFLIDDDRHGTALHAIAESNATAACKMGVCKTFQHLICIIPRGARPAALEQCLDFPFEDVLAGKAGVGRADFSVARNYHADGNANDW